jgi:hypothetical protein
MVLAVSVARGGRRICAVDAVGAGSMHKLASITAESFPSSRKADTVQKLLESSVGPQRIEGRAQQDGCLESTFITLVQPANRLILIAEADIDQGDIGVEGGILIKPAFQVLDYL